MITLPKQNNYQIALDAAWQRLAQREAGAFEALGAAGLPGGPPRWALPTLNERFHVDVASRTIVTASGAALGTVWQILAAHYLLAGVPVPQPRRRITFEEIPEARGYSPPYTGRVLKFFCATVGRNRESLLAAGQGLGAGFFAEGDVGLELLVFPRVPLRIVWYAGDAELPPGVSFLYEDNITSLLDIEDIVVMAERVVSRLRGKPW